MLKQIIKTTLLAGSLDIVAAFIQAYLQNNTAPATVLKFIASGVFGNAAFEGGYGMMTYGLVFHFMIAFCCVFVFFLLYPNLKFLKKGHVLNSVLIALVALGLTHLVIMPLSNAPQEVFSLLKITTAIGILIFCIGLPISIGAKRYYSRKMHGTA